MKYVTPILHDQRKMAVYPAMGKLLKQYRIADREAAALADYCRSRKNQIIRFLYSPKGRFPKRLTDQRTMLVEATQVVVGAVSGAVVMVDQRRTDYWGKVMPDNKHRP